MNEWPLLIPLTEEARSALDGRDFVEIDRIPFRIGRESRLAIVKGELLYMERRKSDSEPNNDLYLFDSGELLNISREHLQIESDGDGRLMVYDRGSACGTHVDGLAIGGRDTTGYAQLRNDSEIIIGTAESPYRFAVQHLERMQARMGESGPMDR